MRRVGSVREAPFDVARESERLEHLSPLDRLRFAVDAFGDDLLFTSSFGTSSAVLLHMWSIVAPRAPVVFIDTGFLFTETLAYRDALAARLGLAVCVVRPAVGREEFLAARGNDFPSVAPDACCQHNKIDPLQPLVDRARAWVSGLRRDQSEEREDVPILLDAPGDPLRVHPLATMTAADVVDYMQRFGLPDHPLKARRYLSVGCAPCTRAWNEGERERAGRWAWAPKTECGLHGPGRVCGAS